MKDRRRRLAKAIAKKEGYEKQFDKQYDRIVNSKSLLMQKYSSLYLEDNLRSTTKNIALELVNILMDTGVKRGILVCLEKKRFKYFTKMMKNKQSDYIMLKPAKVKENTINSPQNIEDYENKKLFHKSKARPSYRDISKEDSSKNDNYSRQNSYISNKSKSY